MKHVMYFFHPDCKLTWKEQHNRVVIDGVLIFLIWI